MASGLSAKTGTGAKVNGSQKALDLEAVGQSSPQLHSGKGDVIPLYRSCPSLLYWDWLFRFWVYFDTPAHWISWYACVGFFFGGQLFIIGSFASIAPAITATEVPGNCMGDTNDWMVYFTYLWGNTFWQVAVVFQMIEALNPGFDERVFDWEMSGKQGPKPKYRWFGVNLKSFAWWGALSYTVGVVLYWTAALATILNDCPNSVLATDVYLWLIDYFYIIAGWLFLLAGALYVQSEISVWLIPGILVPFSWKHAKSLKWWGLWIYWWGGVGFCMGGMQLYWDSPINLVESLDTYNIVTGVGFGGGSICFTVGAALLLMRQARGRCKPSYANVGRLDPTIHVQHFGDGRPKHVADNV